MRDVSEIYKESKLLGESVQFQSDCSYPSIDENASTVHDENEFPTGWECINVSHFLYQFIVASKIVGAWAH